MNNENGGVMNQPTRWEYVSGRLEPTQEGGFLHASWYDEEYRKREQAEKERDAALLEASIWKQEAITQKSTVHEIYQLITDRTGEPGDWNGSEPVKGKLQWLKDRLEERELVRQVAVQLFQSYPLILEDTVNQGSVQKLEEALVNCRDLYHDHQTEKTI